MVRLATRLFAEVEQFVTRRPRDSWPDIREKGSKKSNTSASDIRLGKRP